MKDDRKYKYHCKVIDIKSSTICNNTHRAKELEDNINDWLSANPNIKIINVMRHDYWVVQIVYKEFE